MAAIKPHRKDLYLKKIGDFSFIYSFCDQLMYWIFLDMQSVTTRLTHHNTLGEKMSRYKKHFSDFYNQITNVKTDVYSKKSVFRPYLGQYLSRFEKL